MLVLFALLIATPLIELFLLIKAGGAFGAWLVVGLCIATAAVGAALLRLQSASALADLQRDLNEGRTPVEPVVHGAILLAAAPMLLTPGFVTDALGFILLIPPIRLLIGRHVLRWVRSRMEKGDLKVIRIERY